MMRLHFSYAIAVAVEKFILNIAAAIDIIVTVGFIPTQKKIIRAALIIKRLT